MAALGPLAPGVSEAILRDGRTLLITECARCHRRRLPHEYAIAKWEEVLRGGHRAALSPPQVDALLTYIRETQRLQPPPMNTQK